MSDRHLNPARSVIATMGGVEAVAKITGKHVSRIYRWMHPKERGGTNGRIPHDDAELLLEAAKSAGIQLAPSDFFTSSDAETAA